MTPNERRYRIRNPQAVAWGLLLSSFVMFCTLCAAGTAAARWFLLESQVDLSVHLTVSRGRVDLQLPASVPFGVSQDQAHSDNRNPKPYRLAFLCHRPATVDCAPPV